MDGTFPPVSHAFDPKSFVARLPRRLPIWTERIRLHNELAGGIGCGAVGRRERDWRVAHAYPVEGDRFFAGPAAAYPVDVESTIEFQRGPNGAVTSLTWRRIDRSARSARRLDTQKEEDVTFSNRDIRLAGTLISPT